MNRLRTFLVFGAVTIFITLIYSVSGCGKSPDALYSEGKKLLQDDKTFDQGIKTLERFVEKNPQDVRAPEVMLAIAVALQGAGRFPEAEAAFTRLIEGYASSGEACKGMFLLGYMYSDMPENMDKAKATLEKFITAYPDSELALSAKVLLDNIGRPVDEWSIVQSLSDSTKQEVNR